MSDTKSQYVTIGAGWKKKNHEGKDYISMSLDLEKIFSVQKSDSNKLNARLYDNTRKKEEKHPDYNLVVRVEE